MANLYEDEGLMTDEEARELLIRLGGSATGGLLGFSLFMNHIMNTSGRSDDRAAIHEHIDALADDMHRNAEHILDGKLGEKEGVYRLKIPKKPH